jgi:hypothetical protein
LAIVSCCLTRRRAYTTPMDPARLPASRDQLAPHPPRRR